MPEPFCITSARSPTAVPHLGTLALWRRWAAPAKGDAQWTSGRSAMEMAKAWRGGTVPSEIREGLGGSPFERFDPTHGRAEVTTKFDSRPGPRHHDLLLYGTIDGSPALIDIEGKADEPFDGRSLGNVLRSKSPGLAGRGRDLCRWLFGQDHVTDPLLLDLPYQLVFGFYATVKRAHVEAPPIRRALFLAQVFVNETCRAELLTEGRRELNRFLRALDADGAHISRGRNVVGPIRPRAGSTWADLGVEMWVGRIETWQAVPQRQRPLWIHSCG